MKKNVSPQLSLEPHGDLKRQNQETEAFVLIAL